MDDAMGGRMRLARREDGAVAVLTAITLSLVITAVAMGVDIGAQVFTERRIESIVDLVAYDAGQAIGNHRDPAQNTYDNAWAYATNSATNNGFAYSDTAAGNAMSLELGLADPVTKVFTPFPATASAAVQATANAVRVTGSMRTNYAFMPGNPISTARSVVMIRPKSQSGCVPGSTCSNTCASACAGCAPAACGGCPSTGCSCAPVACWSIANAGMSLGSTMASYDSSRSALLGAVMGGLLHGSVSFDATGYNGLATGSVVLGRLWTELGLNVGSADEVLNTTITLRRLLQAESDVLRRSGDTASVSAANALAAMSTSTDGSLGFTFGDLLDIGMNQASSVASASINVLSLAAAAAEVANGTSLLTFNVPVSLPGVTSATMSMSMIQRPVFAFGAAGQDAAGNWFTHARTAQTRMQLTMNLATPITVGVVSVPLTLPVYIAAGSADSDLTSIACQTINTDSVVGVTARTSALTASIGTVSAGAMANPGAEPTPATATLANVAGVVTVTASGSQSVAGSSTNVTFNGAYAARSQHVGPTAIDLHTLATTATITASGTLFAASAVTQTRTQIDTALSGLDANLLNPLGKIGLGLAIAGSDVGNPSADCLYGSLIAS